jgi:hypothetical protein
MAAAAAAATVAAKAINKIVKRNPIAYFSFGRFQPPTLGHGVLIKGLAELAEKDGADAYIFVSSSQDSRFNPLTISQKIHWLKTMYSDVPVTFINTTTCECKTVPRILGKLADAGYTTTKMFVGSDRISDFQRFVPKSVEVLSLGERRNNTRKNLAGVSGTKMRAAAVAGDLATLQNGTGLTEENARKLMTQIRTGLGKTRRGRRESRFLRTKDK